VAKPAGGPQHHAPAMLNPCFHFYELPGDRVSDAPTPEVSNANHSTGLCLAGSSGSLPMPGPNAYNPASSITCACLGHAVQVASASGECILAADVRAGTKILSNINGKHSEECVVHVFHSAQPCIRITHEAGTLICSTSHHMVVADGSTLQADKLSPESTHLLSGEGKPLAIYDVAWVGTHHVTGWTCLPSHTFIAGGVLHHNKVYQATPSS
jgi:hypothetical protein